MSPTSLQINSHFPLQDPRFESLVYPQRIPVTVSTAGPVTYTSAQLMGGFILRDCAGAARNDTLPSAADLWSNIQGCMVGTSFDFELRNVSAGAFAPTLIAGQGVTISGTASVPQLDTRTYTVVFTNITPGQQAYTVYAGAAGAF